MFLVILHTNTFHKVANDRPDSIVKLIYNKSDIRSNSSMDRK